MTDNLPLKCEAGDLTLGRDGKMYGYLRSSDSNSTPDRIIRLTSDGKVETVHVLASDEGSRIAGRLIFAGDGNLYGSTEFGGLNGSIFRIEPETARFTILASFPREYGPEKRLMCLGYDGELYGVAREVGGVPVIFRCTRAGRLSIFTKIKAAPLVTPLSEPGDLIGSDDGNLYGTALAGGTSDNTNTYGALFKVDGNGNLSIVHAFNQLTGKAPKRIVQGFDRAIYALTERVSSVPRNGVATPYTSLFLKVPLVSDLQVLRTFPPRSFPTDPALTTGVFKGSNGQVFCIRPNETSPEPLMLFRCDESDRLQDFFRFTGNTGARPGGPLQIDVDGTLRGIAASAARENTPLFKLLATFPPVGQLPPIARDDLFTTTNRPRSLPVLRNDSDVTGIAIPPYFPGGTLSIAADGQSINFKPGPDGSAYQSFRYTAINEGGTATAIVHLRRAYPGAVYAGFIPGTNGTGYIRVAISRSGTVTGKLSVGGRDTVLRGSMTTEDMFEADTIVSVATSSGGIETVPAKIAIFAAEDRGSIDFSMVFSDRSLAGSIPQVAESGLGNEGIYHAALPATLAHPPGLQGSGYSRVLVGKSGSVRAVGRLSDGKHFALSGYVTPTGTALVFSTMYVAHDRLVPPPGGMLGGELTFESNESVRKVSANLRWCRANYDPRSQFARMILTQPLKGERWIPGFSLANVAPPANYRGDNGQAVLRQVDGSVRSTPASIGDVDFSTDEWSVAGYLNSQQGLLFGTFRDPATGLQRSFSGLVLPSEKRALGLFFSNGRSGNLSAQVP